MVGSGKASGVPRRPPMDSHSPGSAHSGLGEMGVCCACVNIVCCECECVEKGRGAN